MHQNLRVKFNLFPTRIYKHEAVRCLPFMPVANDIMYEVHGQMSCPLLDGRQRLFQPSDPARATSEKIPSELQSVSVHFINGAFSMRLFHQVSPLWALMQQETGVC